MVHGALAWCMVRGYGHGHGHGQVHGKVRVERRAYLLESFAHAHAHAHAHMHAHAQVRAERRAHLLESFGFECACSLCSLGGAKLKQSERRQRRVGDLFGEIREAFQHAAAEAREITRARRGATARGAPTASAASEPSRPFALPAALVSLVEERLALKEEEGMVELGDDASAMAHFAKALGDTAAAAVWAARAAAAARLALGIDSPEYRLHAAVGGVKAVERAEGSRADSLAQVAAAVA